MSNLDWVHWGMLVLGVVLGIFGTVVYLIVFGKDEEDGSD